MSENLQVQNLANGRSRSPRPSKKTPSPTLESLQKQVLQLTEIVSGQVKELQDVARMGREALAERDNLIANQSERLNEQRETIDELQTAFRAQSELIAGMRAQFKGEIASAHAASVSKHAEIFDALAELRAELGGFDAVLKNQRADISKLSETIEARLADAARALAPFPAALAQMENTTAQLASIRGEFLDMVRSTHTELSEAIDRQGVQIDTAAKNAALGLEAVIASIAGLETKEHARLSFENAHAIADDALKNESEKIRAVITAAVDKLDFRIGSALEASAKVLLDLSAERETRINAISAVTRNAVDLQGLVSGLQESIRLGLDDVRDRLRKTVSVLPKTLIVDKAGVLKAVNGKGELERIGEVVGAAGKSAAELHKAQIRGDSLVLTLSDGREVAAQGILQDVRKELQAQVIHALSLHGMTDTTIATATGLTRRQVQGVLKNAGERIPDSSVKRPSKPRAARKPRGKVERGNGK